MSTKKTAESKNKPTKGLQSFPDASAFRQIIGEVSQGVDEFQRVAKTEKDLNELLVLMRLKLFGEGYTVPPTEIRDQEAFLLFLAWVVKFGSVPFDMKLEAINLKKGIKRWLKKWQTDADRWALGIERMLKRGRRTRGSWQAVYPKEIRGYENMDRDQQVEAEQNLRTRFRHQMHVMRSRTRPAKPKSVT